MELDWFKSSLRKKGLRNEDVAALARRHPSTVSKIFSGQKRMTTDWAIAFAQLLDVPIEEIFRRAGEIPDIAPTEKPRGFGEGDVAPFEHATSSSRQESSVVDAIANILGKRPGVDVWRVHNDSMLLAGYKVGDYILVDTLASELARSGDHVVAQIYQWANGTARTVFRKLLPPVLVSAAPQGPDDVAVVDGNNVVVKGRVIGSWRL